MVKLKTNGLKEAPFDSQGNLEHYPYGVVDWRPNIPMELTITVDQVRSGRSAKYLMWRAANGTMYPMFIADVVELLQEATIEAGTVRGMFRVRKRGSNFGLCYVGPAPERP